MIEEVPSKAIRNKIDKIENENENDEDDNNEESWKDSDFLHFDSTVSSPQPDPGTGTTEPLGQLEISRNGKSNQKSPRPPPPSSSSSSRRQLVAPTNNKNKRLPPWMDRPHDATFPPFNTPKLILLHEEIVQFVNLMKPQKHEIEAREEFVNKVKELIINLFQNDDVVGKGGCEVHVFGSQATGLLLPTSDIDLVVILPDYNPDETDNVNNGNNGSNNDNNNETSLTKEEEQKEMAEYDIHKHSSSNITNSTTTSPLMKLAHELNTKWKNELTYLEVVSNTKVPIVKFTHGPTKLNCDICFNQENGIHAAELMKRFMDAMPPLKPLTFVLKYFMAARGLNEPYSGGCGSFMIQMMIVSFLQHRERYDYNNPLHHHQQQRGRDNNDRHHHRNNNRYHTSSNQNHRGGYNNNDDYDPAPMNLGSLLLEFFELYGIDFNYLTTAISVRHDGYYFPKGHYNKRDIFFSNPTRPFTLGLENPIEITSDVGTSSFRMSLIQKSFEVALRVLLSHVAHPVVHVDSILESIIPPTEEMYKRATIYKVLSTQDKLMNQGYQVVNGDNQKRKGNYNSKEQHGKVNHKRQRRSTTDDSSMDTSDSD